LLYQTKLELLDLFKWSGSTRPLDGPGGLLVARLGPARLHLGVPLIEAMLTRYARCEFFSS
jgi:hypothetical protein